MAKILLTGATGYIASHTWLALLDAGFDVIGVDNFSNSSPHVLQRLAQLTDKTLRFDKGDVCDAAFLDQLFQYHTIDAVIHFAAHKAVGESVAQPLKYYQNNLLGLMSVLNVMKKHQVKHFVFSSSATVYGQAEHMPIRENAPRSANSPYGQTKLMAEYILEDLIHADQNFFVACLRYFNPVGAHPSGLIGEDPQGVPNNLMPYITKVATGGLSHLNIFGNDYPTPDGTGVRDYIHVCDLAQGHVKACVYLLNEKKSLTVNLGTGVGYSVLDMVQTFARVNQVDVPYQIQNRRAGDVATCYADPHLAKVLLNWQATHTLEEMCQSAFLWQQKNPRGYEGLASSPASFVSSLSHS